MKTLTTKQTCTAPGQEEDLCSEGTLSGGGTLQRVLRRCLPVVFCAAFATAASRQTEQLTFSFSANKTGNNPNGNGYGIFLPNGHLVGTALNGGNGANGGGGFGVVFEADPPTSTDSNWSYHEIYRFKGGPADGYGPYNGVSQGKDGTLYGLTDFGGPSSSGGVGGCGIIYQLIPPTKN